MSNRDPGEITKRPSNSSTTRRADTPHHSGFIAARSHAYHEHVISPTYARPSSTRMTRAEHQLNNNEDSHSIGEYTKD
jgi:hypothetical protein